MNHEPINVTQKEAEDKISFWTILSVYLLAKVGVFKKR